MFLRHPVKHSTDRIWSLQERNYSLVLLLFKINIKISIIFSQLWLRTKRKQHLKYGNDTSIIVITLVKLHMHNHIMVILYIFNISVIKYHTLVKKLRLRIGNSLKFTHLEGNISYPNVTLRTYGTYIRYNYHEITSLCYLVMAGHWNGTAGWAGRRRQTYLSAPRAGD